jgi:hypothetical protein
MSTATGFEPVRASPFDFESNSLTTRTRCHGASVLLLHTAPWALPTLGAFLRCWQIDSYSLPVLCLGMPMTTVSSAPLLSYIRMRGASSSFCLCLGTTRAWGGFEESVSFFTRFLPLKSAEDRKADGDADGQTTKGITSSGV